MNAKFTETKKGTWAYIQKKVRIEGRSTTQTIKKLGLLSDISQKEGCADPRQWVVDLAARMTAEEREGKQSISLDFYPSREMDAGYNPLRIGGDMPLLPVYNGLGLPEICRKIALPTKVKYDLNQILQTLVCGRILFPGSKIRTSREARDMVNPPEFKDVEMYRALSLLSEHVDDIQAQVYKNSKNITTRRERVIYYDCTNYFFEIEDNDPDIVMEETGEFVAGLRKRGKSKEHRPNPIVQMGMFMDGDGIPLAFIIFPGNESEQVWLQPLERVLDRKFDLTDFVVSTDCGLASEDNRRYNMAEGRDYICVQSLPSLSEEDQAMATEPHGWRISYCPAKERCESLEKEYSEDGIFNLKDIVKKASEIDGLLKDVTFYKEIIVDKKLEYENPEWLSYKKKHPETTPVDGTGKKIPHNLKSIRKERVIVTYSHDFALFLKHKREERLNVARKIVKRKQTKARQSQQSPLTYVKTEHKTAGGETAVKVEMSINQEVVEQEERLDGFYAYGTSLDDDAVDVLRARSFHHEIEHLFRTTKSFLDARPVYLSRQERIRSHFLICFLAMVVLKILQKQLTEVNREVYTRDNPLQIDRLIAALREIKFGELPGKNYKPMFRRDELKDQLQSLAGIEITRQIISTAKMRANYRKVNKR